MVLLYAGTVIIGCSAIWGWYHIIKDKDNVQSAIAVTGIGSTIVFLGNVMMIVHSYLK